MDRIAVKPSPPTSMSGGLTNVLHLRVSLHSVLAWIIRPLPIRRSLRAWSQENRQSQLDRTRGGAINLPTIAEPPITHPVNSNYHHLMFYGEKMAPKVDFWPYSVCSWSWPLTFWPQNLIISPSSTVHVHQQRKFGEILPNSLWDIVFARTHVRTNGRTD